MDADLAELIHYFMAGCIVVCFCLGFNGGQQR